MAAQLLLDRLRGNGFGVLGLVAAAGDLASAAVVGLLRAVLPPDVGFACAAFWRVAALAVAVFFERPNRDPESRC